jgi:hypothetical protein
MCKVAAIPFSQSRNCLKQGIAGGARQRSKDKEKLRSINFARTGAQALHKSADVCC